MPEEPQADAVDITAGPRSDAPPSVIEVASSQDLSSQCFAEAPTDEPSYLQPRAVASVSVGDATPQPASPQVESRSASALPTDTTPSRSGAVQRSGAASPPVSVRAPGDALSREGSVGFVGAVGTTDGSSRIASVRSSPSEVDMPAAHAAARARAEPERVAETLGTEGGVKRQRTSPDAQQEGAQPPQGAQSPTTRAIAPAAKFPVF